MPLISHWSETGLTVSGVAKAVTMWTLSLRISSWVTEEARFGLDWLSLATISSGCFVPLMVIELAVDFLACSIAHDISS